MKVKRDKQGMCWLKKIKQNARQIDFDSVGFNGHLMRCHMYLSSGGFFFVYCTAISRREASDIDAKRHNEDFWNEAYSEIAENCQKNDKNIETYSKIVKHIRNSRKYPILSQNNGKYSKLSKNIRKYPKISKNIRNYSKIFENSRK